MFNIVQGSKYKAETISIIMSFADVLASGDSITGTPQITITVYTGIDFNPSILLYQGPTVTNGNTVEQRIRLGIPGVIYHILFTIQTVHGDTFDKESYLAILPEDNVAVPLWLPLWESTTLYPYQLEDSLTGTTEVISGDLRQTVIPSGPDYVQSFQLLVGGTLIQSGILYSLGLEKLQGTTNLVGGTFDFYNTILYAIPHEDVKGAIALLGGTLLQSGIAYSIPHEDIQSTTTLVSGTLT
jgi:hypothetical protein